MSLAVYKLVLLQADGGGRCAASHARAGPADPHDDGDPQQPAGEFGEVARWVAVTLMWYQFCWTVSPSDVFVSQFCCIFLKKVLPVAVHSRKATPTPPQSHPPPTQPTVCFQKDLEGLERSIFFWFVCFFVWGFLFSNEIVTIAQSVSILLYLSKVLPVAVHSGNRTLHPPLFPKRLRDDKMNDKKNVSSQYCIFTIFFCYANCFYFALFVKTSSCCCALWEGHTLQNLIPSPSTHLTVLFLKCMTKHYYCTTSWKPVQT